MIRPKARFILFWFLLLIGIFGWVQTGAAEDLKLRVITADAAIRLEPGPESTVVSKVKLGAVLTSKSKAGEWYRIDLPPDADGFMISGFIHQSQVEVVGKAAESRPAAEAAVAFDAPRKVRVNAEKAEIKEEPMFDSRKMGQAPRGTELNAVAMAGEWYKVEVASGIYGYIHQIHVENIEEPAPQAIPKREAVPAAQDRPRDPAPAAPQSVAAMKRKFSLKLTLGFGIGFESFDTGFYKTTGESSKEIIVSPGGGSSFTLDLGYYLTRELRLELGIGFQSSGVSVLKSNDEVTFSRMPLALTLLYEFPSPKTWQIYAGGGAGLYNAPEMRFEVGNDSAHIKYDPSFGLHGLVGAVTRSKTGKWFYFGELRYVGVFNYKWKEARGNGSSFTPIQKYQEFGGNGIFILFGIGLYF
ncbi:MAG: SH3 domain-containing protein [Candidatus Aminicenantaceae bacterium]